MADWTNLPWPALNLISEFLTFSVDYIRFRSVCTSWRSSAPKRRHLPLLAGQCSDDNGLPTIFDFSIFTGAEIIPLGNREPRVTPLGAFCRGSSHGWMAFLDPSPGIFLWNPITKARIQLPYLTHYPDINEGKHYCRKVSRVGDEFVVRYGCQYEERKGRTFPEMYRYLASKVVLSSDPSTDPNCVAVLIHCRWRRLAVCRLGDDTWTKVKFREFINFHSDAVFYKGRFLVVCRQTVYVLNLAPEPTLEMIPMANPPVDEPWDYFQIDESYLVESCDQLLLVNAYYCAPLADTRDYKFEVYKLDWGLHRAKLLRLSSLGDRALFLGRNHSFSLSSTDYVGCRPNCIYFAEYYKAYRPKIRVYNMEDGSNDYISNRSLDSSKYWKPCAWIMPSML